MSGPLLDRIDLCVELQPVDIPAFTGKRIRREQRRDAGENRCGTKNAGKRYAGTDYRFNGDVSFRRCGKILCARNGRKKGDGTDVHTLALSARAYHRILKTARTIADLEGYGEITKDHLLEAACYRPSEEYWN